MKKILIDMDEVLCIKGHLGAVNQFLNTNYTLEDLPGYYAEELIPDDQLEQYYQFFEMINIYDYVTEMKDAKKVLERLSKHYELYICTAYYSEQYNMKQSQVLVHKYHWLQDHFPFISPSHYIFINQKNLLLADVIIDDNLSNLTGNVETKLLFDSYHNQNIPKDTLDSLGIQRVSSFLEIEQILEQKYS